MSNDDDDDDAEPELEPEREPEHESRNIRHKSAEISTGAETVEGFCAEQNHFTGWVFARRRRRIRCPCGAIITRPV